MVLHDSTAIGGDARIEHGRLRESGSHSVDRETVTLDYPPGGTEVGLRRLTARQHEILRGL